MLVLLHVEQKCLHCLALSGHGGCSSVILASPRCQQRLSTPVTTTVSSLDIPSVPSTTSPQLRTTTQELPLHTQATCEPGEAFDSHGVCVCLRF